jgi:tRNA dimethylallyltransferase
MTDRAYRSELLCIVGPTASGKSAFALELAERHGGEIISADSVQVYRHFDIGTGKPSRDELGRVPHHLIDVLEPGEPFDAAAFASHAALRIAEIRARDRLPIVCGGSYLWVRALLYGLVSAPAGSAEIRLAHRKLVEREGRAALHQRLAAVDPESFHRLSPNDFVRVSRALEVYELTGQALSRLQAAHGFRELRYQARLLAIRRTAEELRQRIAERTALMLAAGWLEEVQRLEQLGYGTSRAMQAVGYRQLREALQAGPPSATVAESIVRATRIFARRQLTWLRDEPIVWLSPAELSSFAERAYGDA